MSSGLQKHNLLTVIKEVAEDVDKTQIKIERNIGPFIIYMPLAITMASLEA